MLHLITTIIPKPPPILSYKKGKTPIYPVFKCFSHSTTGGITAIATGVAFEIGSR